MPTLQWSNRDEAVRSSARVPFRVLEHDAKLSCGDTPSENMRMINTMVPVASTSITSRTSAS